MNRHHFGPRLPDSKTYTHTHQDETMHSCIIAFIKQNENETFNMWMSLYMKA